MLGMNLYVGEAVEQAASKHDHDPQLPLDSAPVQLQPLKATATESMYIYIYIYF